VKPRIFIGSSLEGKVIYDSDIAVLLVGICCGYWMIRRQGRIMDLYLIRSIRKRYVRVLLIPCSHHHRAALADSMAVIKSPAVIICRNG
jgi:hypothetical protein